VAHLAFATYDKQNKWNQAKINWTIPLNGKPGLQRNQQEGVLTG